MRDLAYKRLAQPLSAEAKAARLATMHPVWMLLDSEELQAACNEQRAGLPVGKPDAAGRVFLQPRVRGALPGAAAPAAAGAPAAEGAPAAAAAPAPATRAAEEEEAAVEELASAPAPAPAAGEKRGREEGVSVAHRIAWRGYNAA